MCPRLTGYVGDALVQSHVEDAQALPWRGTCLSVLG